MAYRFSMALLILVWPMAAGAQPPALQFKERVVAGSETDFMEVRHLILRSSNYEIGKKLAEIAKVRHGVGPIRYRIQRRTQVQLRYFKKYYPVHVERMRGAAAAFGISLEDTSLNVSGLFYNSVLPGCSAVFFPPQATTDGRGVLSRNFDFSVGTLISTKPPEGTLPAAARPYVIEMYPDEGFASLVTCCFDLLGGVMDGINSEGLTIAVLADGEIVEKHGVEPMPIPQAGFNEIQIVRYLLDTCADVEQAKDALLEAKLYYSFLPNHYIVADRHGRSFVWENDERMRRGYIIPGRGEPQITTNFMLHLHRDPAQLPAEEHRLGMFNRYRSIRRRLAEHDGKVDIDFIKETNQRVSCTQNPPSKPQVANRTLWHALYYPEARRGDLDFYLGETPDPDSPGSVKIRRSGYQTFRLKTD